MARQSFDTLDSINQETVTLALFLPIAPSWRMSSRTEGASVCQRGKQSANFFFDLLRAGNSVGDFLAQQSAVTLAEAVDRNLHRALAQSLV